MRALALRWKRVVGAARPAADNVGDTTREHSPIRRLPRIFRSLSLMLGGGACHSYLGRCMPQPQWSYQLVSRGTAMGIFYSFVIWVGGYVVLVGGYVMSWVHIGAVATEFSVHAAGLVMIELT